MTVRGLVAGQGSTPALHAGAIIAPLSNGASAAIGAATEPIQPLVVQLGTTRSSPRAFAERLSARPEFRWSTRRLAPQVWTKLALSGVKDQVGHHAEMV
jgi:hypothetical protein